MELIYGELFKSHEIASSTKFNLFQWIWKNRRKKASGFRSCNKTFAMAQFRRTMCFFLCLIFNLTCFPPGSTPISYSHHHQICEVFSILSVWYRGDRQTVLRMALYISEHKSIPRGLKKEHSPDSVFNGDCLT